MHDGVALAPQKFVGFFLLWFLNLIAQDSNLKPNIGE
jgi:hypothetical protein